MPHKCLIYIIDYLPHFFFDYCPVSTHFTFNVRQSSIQNNDKVKFFPRIEMRWVVFAAATNRIFCGISLQNAYRISVTLTSDDVVDTFHFAIIRESCRLQWFMYSCLSLTYIIIIIMEIKVRVKIRYHPHVHTNQAKMRNESTYWKQKWN